MILPPLPAQVTVEWPPERLPARLVVNSRGIPHRPGRVYRFHGSVRFRTNSSLVSVRGELIARAGNRGWTVAWTTSGEGWVAAAVAGELGDQAPFEARRALASVLWLWLAAHPHGHHSDGSLCPLTHCAVVRGTGSQETVKAVAQAPNLMINPEFAFFTGSKGGKPLSPRQVWGGGPSEPGTSEAVPGDRWANWTRHLIPAQVRILKASVAPGVKPGQQGLMLGPSGPFAVEALRLAAGRAFGWTAWPSNACTAETLKDGGLELRGSGWGHNVGLDLSEAIWRASRGERAEAILQAAFGDWMKALDRP